MPQEAAAALTPPFLPQVVGPSPLIFTIKGMKNVVVKCRTIARSSATSACVRWREIGHINMVLLRCVLCALPQRPLAGTAFG